MVVHVGFVVGKVANFCPNTSVFIPGASTVDKHKHRQSKVKHNFECFIAKMFYSLSGWRLPL